jgi:hypothetical protein
MAQVPQFSMDPLYQQTQDKLYSAGQSWLSGDIGIDMPSYVSSPYYKESQDVLSGLGKNILSGNVPEYFRGIGEAGGIDFQNMLNLTNRDVARGVNEDIVRRGVSRGGVGTSAIAKAISDSSIKARFEDYSRSMEGRKALLGAGIDIMGGTRSAGLTETNMQNLFGLDTAKMGIGIRETGLAALGDTRSAALTQSAQKQGFDLSSAELQLKIDEFNAAQEQAKKAAKGSMWGSILGAVGTIGGAIVGGPVGASIGSSLGGLFGGGNTPDSKVGLASVAKFGTKG